MHSRGWLDFEIKGGVFGNRGSLNTSYVPASGAGVPDGRFEYSDQRDRTAFLGELSLSYSHQVCSVMSVRARLQRDLADRPVLASQNMPTDIDMLTGNLQVSQCGDLVFHGPHGSWYSPW